jgi:hypothetical protein
MTRQLRSAFAGCVTLANLALCTIAEAKDYAVVIAPALPLETRRAIAENTVSFVLGDCIRPGDRILIIDGKDRQLVTTFEVPPSDTYKHQSARKAILRRATDEFLGYIRKESQGTLSVPRLLDGTSAIRVAPDATDDTDILMVADALHSDSDERFSMDNGRVPSDGHLHAKIEASPFGHDGTQPLRKTRVSWITAGSVWKGDLHERKVMRFWAAYVEKRGSKLISFTSDMKATFKSLCSSNLPAIEAVPPVDVGTRLTMDAVRRDAEEVEAGSIFSKPPTQAAVIPSPKARLRIGLQWEGGGRADVDLYAKSRTSKEWIYFGREKTVEGNFFKFTGAPSKPTKGFEYIEFTQVPELRDLEIAVNFYEGQVPGGPKGRILFEVDRAVYPVEFHIRNAVGNKGVGYPDKMGRNSAWVMINAADVISGKRSFVSSN